MIIAGAVEIEASLYIPYSSNTRSIYNAARSFLGDSSKAKPQESRLDHNPPYIGACTCVHISLKSTYLFRIDHTCNMQVVALSS